MKYVVIDKQKIEVSTAYQCCKLKRKTKTIIINQQYYLKKDDVVGFLCSNCNKVEEQQFRFKTKFLKPTLCNSCNKSINNPYKREDVKDKIKQTKLEKYKNSVFTNREKAKNTMIDRYGVEYALQENEFKNKIKETNVKKYGVSYPLKNKEIYDKMSQTKKDRYNNKNYNNRKKYLKTMDSIREDVNKKIKETKLKNTFLDFKNLSIIEPLFDINIYKNKTYKYEKFSWRCKTCDTVFEDYFASGRIPRCPTCYPPLAGTSKYEEELFNWLKSLNIKNIVQNNRSILNGKELDLYLPDYNLAIEFNGLYWHGERQGKDRNYHLNKTLECKEKNIQLIHIFENEWLDKQDIVKSIIKGKLGLNDKIYARKCVIKEVDNQKEFLEENHLQGFINSSINIGLFYNDELVSILTLGKSRYSKQYSWEILRFANKLNTSVIGGFAKMLKYFERNYNGSIITYSDRRYFDGSIYRNNGFIELESSKQNYWYFQYKNLFSRIQFQKHKLEEKLNVYDSNLTEWENMQLNGWDRIWDCGNYKFIKKAGD